MALCQTTGIVESLLRLTGLDWDVPDLSTIYRSQKSIAVNIRAEWRFGRGADAVVKQPVIEAGEDAGGTRLPRGGWRDGHRGYRSYD
jgi:hypothetical protein